MPKYNPDIHHRRSIRLQHYDYSQVGVYFITLCTLNRECLFGDIQTGEMHLNGLGLLVRDEWLKTPQIRPNITLGAWVLMPNHFHAIIEIHKHPPCRGVLHTPSSPSQTLGAIVRGFKSAATRRANAPIWQRNYWEHVIRTQESLHDITAYIHNNPSEWERDVLHPTA